MQVNIEMKSKFEEMILGNLSHDFKHSFFADKIFITYSEIGSWGNNSGNLLPPAIFFCVFPQLLTLQYYSKHFLSLYCVWQTGWLSGCLVGTVLGVVNPK